MTKYTWFKKELPPNIDIKQVYGIVFSDTGNIILRIDDNKYKYFGYTSFQKKEYKLTGGKPESFDSNLKDTLKREYLEELNIEIKDIYYLGYLLVEEDLKEKYAQVRMIAKIKNIGEIRPDKDNGKTYKRFMSNVKNVKHYLNYPDLAGNELIDDAIIMAKEKYYLNFSDDEYFI